MTNKHVCPNCGEAYVFDELGAIEECCSAEMWQNVDPLTTDEEC